MEVILLERIHRLGGMGDTVRVRDGFARNFLIPQKKALRATEANKKVFEARRAEIEAHNAAERGKAQAYAAKLENVAVTLVRQASEEGKLYGSVTVRDIADALKAQGHDINRSLVVVKQTIKNTGSFTAELHLHPEVIAPIAVNVVRNESENAA